MYSGEISEFLMLVLYGKIDKCKEKGKFALTEIFI
jgi:hypothetical protein